MIKHGLAIKQGLSVAILSLALSASAFAQAQTKSIAQLVPASTTGAVFFSVENVMSSFGSVFCTGSLGQRMDELVSHGLPDPRKDVRDVGVAFDFNDTSDRNAGIVARGKVDMKKVIAFFQGEGAAVTQEAYRGVTLNVVKRQHDEETLRVAAADEQTSLFSNETNPEFPAAKKLVDTFSGASQSYGDAHHTVLPKGYFVSVAWDVPESLRHQATQNPMTAPLAAVTNIAGTLKEEADKSVKLELGLTCDSAPNALILRAAFEQLLAQLIERTHNDPQTLAILKSIKLETNGAVDTITMELPRKQIEDILTGMNN